MKQRIHNKTEDDIIERAEWLLGQYPDGIHIDPHIAQIKRVCLEILAFSKRDIKI